MTSPLDAINVEKHDVINTEEESLCMQCAIFSKNNYHPIFNKSLFLSEEYFDGTCTKIT